MKIKAVSSLRGELVLSSIGKSIRADKELSITEESYYNDDIQLMLKSGRIFVSEGTEAVPTGSTIKDEAKLDIRCIHSKPVVIASLPYALQPNATYGLTLRQFKTEEVQQALACGMIAPVDAAATALAKQAIIDAVLEEQAQADKDAKEDEDAADRFYRTREAQTIAREVETKPKDTYIYDPNNSMAEKKTPKDSYIYDPHGNQQRKPSPNLPIRGQIKPVGPQGYDDLPATQSSRQPAPQLKRAGSGGRKIRPIGGSGNDLGGDGVEMEIL